MKDIFISDYLGVDNKELKKYGVFDSIINRDSNFFINILRLKKTKTPEFLQSYNNINNYYRDIMTLLDLSKVPDDKLYREALRKFAFSEVNGINLGFSESKGGSGFGKKLAKIVVKDAYDIVKTGSVQPEIFHLVGLFEENIGADRLSDMIATIILDDIKSYTRRINCELGINSDSRPNLEFYNGIVFNPYKQCELLYVPTEILHELPIARDWSEIDRVIAENEIIRREINEAVGESWYKMASAEKKEYIKEHIFKNPDKCARVLNGYQEAELAEYDLSKNLDYNVACIFKNIIESGVLNFLIHGGRDTFDSQQIGLLILENFKHWIENQKGWELILQAPSNHKEKTVQKLIQLCGQDICDKNNFDFSFEADEGPGPSDIKISRGSKDKTIIEVKLNSNPQYLHGYKEQIEIYKTVEKTEKGIYLYVKVETHPSRDAKLQALYEDTKILNISAPLLYVIDARKKESASVR